MRTLLITACLLAPVVAYAAEPATPAAPVPAVCQPTFTADESKVLLQLIDMAVKAGGLSVAGNADYLARKIDATLKPKAEPKKEEN